MKKISEPLVKKQASGFKYSDPCVQLESVGQSLSGIPAHRYHVNTKLPLGRSRAFHHEQAPTSQLDQGLLI